MSVGAGSLKRTAKSVSTAKEDAKEVKPAQQETLEADKSGTKTVQDKKAPVKAVEAVKRQLQGERNQLRQQKQRHLLRRLNRLRRNQLCSQREL